MSDRRDKPTFDGGRSAGRLARSRPSVRGPRRRGALPLGVLLAVAIVVLAVIALAGSDHGVNGLLGSHQASAATPCAQPLAGGPHDPDRAARPDRLDGTTPLWVRLSGTPLPLLPAPAGHPGGRGAWSTNGDSEYFTPASTLEPCTSYELTIPAAIDATGQTPLGKTRTVALTVACPPVKALQQALARLGYLPYTFHSLYGVHLPGGGRAGARPPPSPFTRRRARSSRTSAMSRRSTTAGSTRPPRAP